jgi:uncharacterized membrane protein YtjA (UPF0391 family)
MLRLDALGFLLFAVIAAFVGYGGIANYSWDGAKILVFVSLALAALCLLVDAVERRWVKESAPAVK